MDNSLLLTSHQSNQTEKHDRPSDDHFHTTTMRNAAAVIIRLGPSIPYLCSAAVLSFPVVFSSLWRFIRKRRYCTLKSYQRALYFVASRSSPLNNLSLSLDVQTNRNNGGGGFFRTTCTTLSTGSYLSMAPLRCFRRHRCHRRHFFFGCGSLHIDAPTA